MAKDHRRISEEVAQGILLDNPTFLKEIVERVLQELLETEMTEHIGAAPYERTGTRTGRRNGYKPRTLRTRVAPSSCSSRRTAKVPSLPDCSPATSETRRLWCWRSWRCTSRASPPGRSKK
jgi:Transposase, Mutator family